MWTSCRRSSSRVSRAAYFSLEFSSSIVIFDSSVAILDARATIPRIASSQRSRTSIRSTASRISAFDTGLTR